jgi:hypothetical protein
MVADGTKRPRAPVLAALRNSRVSRSLDTLPADDMKHAAAAVAKSASQQRPASSPDTSPEVSRRKVHTQ